jgi:uncharacterized protein YeaO (DUF488 family)
MGGILIAMQANCALDAAAWHPRNIDTYPLKEMRKVYVGSSPKMVHFFTMMKLHTIGYEGVDLVDFLRQLVAAKVAVVVDVRELPLSRKKGFSKSALSAVLAARGIEYVHMSALGCPKPIRQRYKLDGDWPAYERSFRAHLKSQGAAVRAVADLARRRATCLLCFEADYSKCHRSFVARAAVAAGAPQAIHLTPKTRVFDAPLRAAA